MIYGMFFTSSLRLGVFVLPADFLPLRPLLVVGRGFLLLMGVKSLARPKFGKEKLKKY